MAKFLGGVALSVLLAAPAMAADLPVRAPVRAPIIATDYNWAGYYVGVQAGGGWGDSSWTIFPNAVTSTEHDLSGFAGGFHIGVNWQSNRLVFGIEGSASLTGMEGNSLCPNPAVRCESDIDHFWRAGGRLGFAAGQTGNWLIYGSGGFARAKLDSRLVVVATNTEFAQTSKHHHGWYFGGGIDYAATANWIVGVEAYRVSLDSERHFLLAGAASAGNTRDIDLDFTVVQARATWKFR